MAQSQNLTTRIARATRGPAVAGWSRRRRGDYRATSSFRFSPAERRAATEVVVIAAQPANALCRAASFADFIRSTRKTCRFVRDDHESRFSVT